MDACGVRMTATGWLIAFMLLWLSILYRPWCLSFIYIYKDGVERFRGWRGYLAKVDKCCDQRGVIRVSDIMAGFRSLVVIWSALRCLVPHGYLSVQSAALISSACCFRLPPTVVSPQVSSIHDGVAVEAEAVRGFGFRVSIQADTGKFHPKLAAG